MDLWSNASVILGLAAGALAFALAAIVLAANPQRLVNRLLALHLAADGVVQSGEMVNVLLGLPPASPVIYVTRFTIGAIPFVYLLLLSVLETPLVRWLQPRAARWTMGALAVGLGTLFMLGRLRPAPVADVLLAGVYAFIIVVLLFALVAALDALRRAEPGSLARRRAEAFVASFGVRDTLGIVGLGMMVAGALAGGATAGLAKAPVIAIGDNIIRLGTIIAMPLLTYGILRNQLFDIDLRLKRGIERGTVVTVFVLVFYVAAKVAETYLSREAGWVAGAIAAGLLLFAAPRLSKAAERVSSTALPGVAASPGYIAYRKLEVYKAAVESALETGPLDTRERAILDRLRAKLGLSAADAAAIEADLAETRGAGQPA